ncbi:uncharacterized protein LOC111642711 [Centruroides sculpturatus]|uniref:uncharacterized protein LOC111642711 n=1 Tax=Centruroides sculpturatus TaxID=218467 RepID=UPI000C6DC2EE|nr:uncharacterized protein LOC111642711 [Centruroides sculpturatus]
MVDHLHFGFESFRFKKAAANEDVCVVSPEVPTEECGGAGGKGFLGRLRRDVRGPLARLVSVESISSVSFETVEREAAGCDDLPPVRVAWDSPGGGRVLSPFHLAKVVRDQPALGLVKEGIDSDESSWSSSIFARSASPSALATTSPHRLSEVGTGKIRRRAPPKSRNRGFAAVGGCGSLGLGGDPLRFSPTRPLHSDATF